MTKNITVNGKVALVTGSNRGIGKAIVEELIAKGASKVYAGARDVSSLDSLKEKHGDKLVPIKLDVTNADDVSALAESASDVEILVNNAGIFAPGNFGGENLAEGIRDNFAVNVFGLISVTKALLPAIKAKESGAIVNVSSVVGLACMPMGIAYSSSKAAVHSITQGLRGELIDSNVLVAEVMPGPIDTDMTKGMDAPKDSVENVAANTIDGIEAGNEDIFPDVMSVQVGEAYSANPKAVEKQFSAWR